MAKNVSSNPPRWFYAVAFLGALAAFWLLLVSLMFFVVSAGQVVSWMTGVPVW